VTVDVTPIIGTDRQVIESYGQRSFRVSGKTYEGAILVFPDATRPWSPARLSEITLESLQPIIAHGGIEVLLLGCGRRLEPVRPELRKALRQAGIVVDPMDTGAACRTYSVLLAEDRRVAAALLPLG
jgi:uncharacterized protein